MAKAFVQINGVRFELAAPHTEDSLGRELAKVLNHRGPDRSVVRFDVVPEKGVNPVQVAVFPDQVWSITGWLRPEREHGRALVL